MAAYDVDRAKIDLVASNFKPADVEKAAKELLKELAELHHDFAGVLPLSENSNIFVKSRKGTAIVGTDVTVADDTAKFKIWREGSPAFNVRDCVLHYNAETARLEGADGADALVVLVKSALGHTAPPDDGGWRKER